MNWDFSSLTDVGWIIGIVISLFGLFYTRKTKPEPMRKIVIRSKEPDSGLGLLLIGGILGFLIGSSLNDGDDEE